MKLSIGVMGSATGKFNASDEAKAYALGRSIVLQDCILITGGCPGLPYAAVQGARAEGGLVVGISPGLSRDEHVYKYESPVEGFDLLIYTGSGLMGREVENIRSSDIVVIIGGSSGTLGEFAIAYDEGKLIGVLSGTGGVADAIDELLGVCQKPTGAVVIADINPEHLISRLIEYYHTKHYQRPNCFCRAEHSAVSDLAISN